MIDIESLINAPVSGPMSTERPQCPEGEFTAIVDSLSEKGINGWIREFTSKRDGEKGLIAAVPFVILDEAVKAAVHRERVIVPAEQFLDIDGGKISTKDGENVLLGQLRAALDQQSDPSWTLSKVAGGGPVKVRVRHTTSESGGVFPKIVRISKIA